MPETDFNKTDVSSTVKNHEEIMDMLTEIKEFEKRFPEYKIEEESRIDKIKAKTEIPQEKIKQKQKKKPFIFRIKLRSKSKVKKRKKERKPTTIKFRLTEEGNLVDVNKKKIKPKKKHAKFLNFKKLIKRKEKGDKKEKSKSEITSFKDKIVSSLGKISALKKVIPTKETEEEKTSTKE